MVDKNEDIKEIDSDRRSVCSFIYKSYFVWKRLMFSEVLKGTVTIGEEEYNLQPWNLYNIRK